MEAPAGPGGDGLLLPLLPQVQGAVFLPGSCERPFFVRLNRLRASQACDRVAYPLVMVSGRGTARRGAALGAERAAAIADVHCSHAASL